MKKTYYLAIGLVIISLILGIRFYNNQKLISESINSALSINQTIDLEQSIEKLVIDNVYLPHQSPSKSELSFLINTVYFEKDIQILFNIGESAIPSINEDLENGGFYDLEDSFIFISHKSPKLMGGKSAFKSNTLGISIPNNTISTKTVAPFALNSKQLILINEQAQKIAPGIASTGSIMGQHGLVFRIGEFGVVLFVSTTSDLLIPFIKVTKSRFNLPIHAVIGSIDSVTPDLLTQLKDHSIEKIGLVTNPHNESLNKLIESTFADKMIDMASGFYFF